MAKKTTRQKLVKKLDTVFSHFIRQRHKNENGIVECVTCGKEDHWKSMDCGHFMSRKHISTRWNEDNCQVQCKACNVFRYGEQYKYSLWLGSDKADHLMQLSRQVLKLSTFDLEDMIRFYEDKVSMLE